MCIIVYDGYHTDPNLDWAQGGPSLHCPRLRRLEFRQGIGIP